MIHGTKKQKRVRTQQQVQQEQELSSKINAKLSDFFTIRSKPYSDELIPKYMEFTSLLMQLCSDIPTIFNFRRELLQRAVKIEQNDTQKKAQLLINQVKLVTKLIRQDPKSYTLWSFRQWLVQNIYQINKAIVNEEKQLCKLLLTKDEKNFHVWNYRNWVNSIQLKIDEELLFTEQKIKSNPFNFSPYHFRSKYLPLKYTPFLNSSQVQDVMKIQIVKYGMPKQVFVAQLQTIKTAIYLNPNQQAPWIYYRWLLKRLLPAIVLCQEVQNNKLRVILNQRVSNLSKFMRPQKHFKLLTTEGLSDTWQFQSVDNSALKLQIPSQDYSQHLVQTEGILKRLIISSQSQQLNEIRQIYRVEGEYIRQILQEETKCRFAYLELLQMLRNQLYLTCQKQQWNQIVSQGQTIFKHLDKQAKTKQYIQKLKQFWFKLSNEDKLSEQHKLLIR